jgi:hypothetical protein
MKGAKGRRGHRKYKRGFWQVTFPRNVKFQIQPVRLVIIRTRDGQGDLNDPRTARDPSKEASHRVRRVRVPGDALRNQSRHGRPARARAGDGAGRGAGSDSPRRKVIAARREPPMVGLAPGSTGGPSRSAGRNSLVIQEICVSASRPGVRRSRVQVSPARLIVTRQPSLDHLLR